MMKKTITFVLICFVTHIAFSQESITVGRKFKVYSEALNEEREVWVGLPSNYDSTVRYPTLYVLDAESQFDITLSLTKELAHNGKIPEHIVVGIPRIDETNRFKDLTFSNTHVNAYGEADSSIARTFNVQNTGGGNLFFKYLRDDVVPFIQGAFNSNGFDVLIGHSLSGYFGAYIMTLDSPFEAYQLYDPSFWYNNGDVINHYFETVERGLRSNVFITTALEGTSIPFHVRMHDSLNRVLMSDGINTQLKIYPDENHGSVRLPSLIDGLTDLYTGYSIGFISPQDTITVEDVQNHFQAFSKKVNYEFWCPYDLYRWVGYANHFQGKWMEAIKAYKLSFPAFQNDLYVLKELANCYYELENYELSLVNYKKVLAIDDSDKTVLKRINELKQRTNSNE